MEILAFLQVRVVRREERGGGSPDTSGGLQRGSLVHLCHFNVHRYGEITEKLFCRNWKCMRRDIDLQ